MHVRAAPASWHSPPRHPVLQGHPLAAPCVTPPSCQRPTGCSTRRLTGRQAQHSTTQAWHQLEYRHLSYVVDAGTAALLGAPPADLAASASANRDACTRPAMAVGMYGVRLLLSIWRHLYGLSRVTNGG